MSWKQYGGTDNLENMSNINVNTITSQGFRLRSAYPGNFDICGNLNVHQSLYVTNKVDVRDIVVGNSVFISKDLTVEGNINSSKNIFLTLGFFQKLSCVGNASLNGDTYISERLYLDSYDNSGNTYVEPRGNLFLKGNSSLLGINTDDPQYMLDINGNTSNILSVKSSQENTRNIISRNNTNHGIIVESNTSSSSIKFYNDRSITNTYGNIADAAITYNIGGNLTIDVSNNTSILSNVVISNIVRPHLLNETVIIYDNYNNSSNTTPNSGNALSLVSFDNSSVAFLNIITPAKGGYLVGGGAYTNDVSRQMGTMGLLDTSGTYVPSQMIVSGNNAAKYRSTIGFNTYSPRVDQYVVDINGPVHITNGQLKLAAIADFEIKSIAGKSGTSTVIATGTPSSLKVNDLYTQNYQYFNLYSNDYGQSWQKIQFPTNSITRLSEKASNMIASYTYDNSFSIICGQTAGILYSVDGGLTWYGFGIGNYTFNSSNIFTSVVIDASYIWLTLGNTVIYFENPYSNKPINDSQTLASPDDTYTIVSAYGYTVNNISCPGNIISLTSNATYIFATTYNDSTSESTISRITITTTNIILNTIKSNKYTSIICKDNIIAVGNNIISYSKNNGNAYFDVTLASGIKLNDVFIIDLSNAIVVGDNATILYSSDGYNTWIPIPEDILNSSGNYEILNDRRQNFTNVTMSDSNTIIISSTVTAYNSDSTLGKSYIFYCFVPNLFNRVNNNVLDVSGNMNVTGDINISNIGRFTNTTQSVSSSTGALIVGGGAGIGANVFVGGNANIRSNVQSVSSSTGALIVSGGAGVAANVFVGGNVNIGSNVDSTSTSSGALIVNGGVGIKSNLYVGDNTRTTTLYCNNIESSPSNSHIIIGSITNADRNIDIGSIAGYNGGNTTINIGKYSDKVIIGGNIQFVSSMTASGEFMITNTTESNATNSGALTVSGGVGIKSNLFVGGNTNIQSNVESTSSSTGALIVNGGVGIKSNLFVGGNTNIKSTVESVSSSTGALIVSGGMGLAANLFVGGNINIQSTVESTSSSTGALIVNGGVGIKSNLFVGGNTNIQSTIQSTSSSSGALIVSGGMGLAANLFVGGNTNIKSTVESVSSSSGALIVSGGIGLAANLFVGGNTNIKSNVESTSSSSGALIVNGGIGLAANLFVGGNTNIKSNVESTSSSSGALIVNGGIGLAANLFVGGNTNIKSTIQSTSSSTGALIVNGGVGLAANLFVGGNTNIQSTVESVSSSTGALIVSGGVGIKSNLFVGGNANIQSTLESTSSSTGALIVSGGVGIKSNLFVGGNANIQSTVESVSSSTGALIVSGGVGIKSNLFVGGNTNIQSTIQSTSSSSGALIVNGGMGLAANLFVGGNTNIQSTIQSTSSSSGALIVSGGIGLAANLFVGGNTNIKSNVESTSSSSGALIVNGGVGLAANLFVGGNTNIKSTVESVSSSTGALIVNGGVGLAANLFVGGNTNIKSTVESTSSSTGALIVNGGVGLAANLFVGGNTNIKSTVESVSSSTGALIVSGGVGLAANLFVGGNTNIKSTVESVSSSTGALVVTGGVGIKSNLFVGGNANIQSTVESVSSSTGALIVSGGVGIKSNLFVGGNTNIKSTVESVSSSTGALIVSGGMGLAANLFVGGNTNIKSTVESTSSSTGALIVNGGVGLAANLFVGGNTNIQSTVESTSSSTGALIVSGGVGLAANLFVGGNIYTPNDVFFYDGVSKTSYTSIGQDANGIFNITNTKSNGNYVINSNASGTNTTIMTWQPTKLLLGSGYNLEFQGTGNITQTSSSATNKLHTITMNTNAVLIQSGTGNITQSGTGTNTLKAITMLAGNNLIQTGGSIIDQSSSTGGTNIMKDITMNANCNLLQSGIGVITQSGTGTNDLKGTTFSGNNTHYNGSAIIQCNSENAVSTSLSQATVTSYIIENNYSSSNIYLRNKDTAGNQVNHIFSHDGITLGNNLSLPNSLIAAFSHNENQTNVRQINNGFYINNSANSGSIILQTVDNIPGSTLEHRITTSYNGTAIKNNLTVSGSVNATFVKSSGNVHAENILVPSTGTITSGSFNATSDYRIKSNIVSIHSTHYTIDNLKPVYYFNTQLKKNDMGFIAHEVQEEFPFLVNGEKDGTHYQNINYNGFIGLLVKELQDLKNRVRELEDKLQQNNIV